MKSATFRPDFYDRLGVDPSIEPQALRRQYRLLARLFHPDISIHPDTHERFVAIRDAYEVLADKERRAAYDAWLQENVRTARPIQTKHISSPQTLVDREEVQRLYVLLELKAALLDKDDATPLELILVLDRSSSMRGERFYRVTEAVGRISERMGVRDSLTLITFNDRAQVVLPRSSPPRQEVVQSVLQNIAAEGGTEIASGLEASLTAAQRHQTDDGRLTHIILLTDGRTYGDEEQCLDLAGTIAAEGVGLTLFGVGTDWNDEFLDQIAGRAQGETRYIASPATVARYFEEEVSRLRRIVVRDVTVEITPDQNNQLLAVHEVTPNLQPIPTEPQGTVTLGTLSVASPLQLLLVFGITPSAGHSVSLAAEMTVRAQLIDRSASFELPRIIVTPVEAPGYDSSGGMTYADEIVEAARRVAALHLQEYARSAVIRGDVTRAITSLSRLATHFLELGRSDLAEAVRREVTHLEQAGRLSAEGSKEIKYGTRRLALPPSERSDI